MRKNKCFFCFLGSHIGSIECVLEHRTTAAAVDSNVLCNFLNKYPHQRDHLHVLTSFGPLPTYPIVFNSKLPGKTSLIIQTILRQWKPIWNSLHNRRKRCDWSGKIWYIMNACKMFSDPSKSVLQKVQMLKNACECGCKSFNCVVFERRTKNMGNSFA